MKLTMCVVRMCTSNICILFSHTSQCDAYSLGSSSVDQLYNVNTNGGKWLGQTARNKVHVPMAVYGQGR